MKAHIQKYKSMLDEKTILNVVVGIFVAICLAKFIAVIGWSLGISGHREYRGGGERMQHSDMMGERMMNE